MDSFAGSEPREFIPFYLGIDANGQPVQESTENNGIENEPGAANSQAAQETSSTSVNEGVLVSSQQTSSPSSLANCLLLQLKSSKIPVPSRPQPKGTLKVLE